MSSTACRAAFSICCRQPHALSSLLFHFDPIFNIYHRLWLDRPDGLLLITMSVTISDCLASYISL